MGSLNAVIFGANGGIGSELVRSLASNDNFEKVFAFSSNSQQFNLDKVVQRVVDINDELSIKSAAEKVDENLDLVVVASGMLHNQNIWPEKSIKDLSAKNFEEIFKVNTIAPAIIAKYFLPKLNKSSRSVFAAISARVSSISDNRLGGWYAYRSSKAALNMILKNLSIEIARTNKKAIILGLHPGTVDSKLSKPFQGSVADQKLFSPNYSATKMLEVIFNAKYQDSGNLFAYDGKKIDP